MWLLGHPQPERPAGATGPGPRRWRPLGATCNPSPLIQPVAQCPSAHTEPASPAVHTTSSLEGQDPPPSLGRPSWSPTLATPAPSLGLVLSLWVGPGSRRWWGWRWLVSTAREDASSAAGADPVRGSRLHNEGVFTRPQRPAWFVAGAGSGGDGSGCGRTAAGAVEQRDTHQTDRHECREP